MSEITCPKCGSAKIIKKGVRKGKLKKVQIYFCKRCKKTFSLAPIKKTKYPARIILNSISFYNLGYTQKQTSKLIGKKHRIKVPQRTINYWINKFKPVCKYHKIRNKINKVYPPEELILKTRLNHSQIYNYQLHKGKLNIQKNFLGKRKYNSIKNYLYGITKKKYPHVLFQKEENIERASKIDLDLLEIRERKTINLANKSTKLGLNLAKNNRERHEMIQKFMLVNDLCTIATEIPVYLKKEDLMYYRKNGFLETLEPEKAPITGHIDILQVRKDMIHILDYKPNASKSQPIEQLTTYALGLASRTKLSVKDFKCAWFDEKNYYEFYPLHAVYRKID
jgi:transposase-like protein